MFYALLFAATQASSASNAVATQVPVRYIADRVIAEPRTADGHTLKFWVDTGGGGFEGMYILTDTAARYLHLKVTPVAFDKQSMPLASLPTFAPGAGIPPPAGRYAKAIVIPSKSLPHFDPMHYDGMLGAGYLPGNPVTHERIWTFDYPGGHLTLEAANWKPSASAHPTPLHFPLDAKGHLASGFARIVVHVDGKTLNMLLDTGATGYPTPTAMAAEGGTATVRATSFITTDQLDRWHKAHPRWRVIAAADQLQMSGKPMRAIEVPSVVIAGWRIGPVWFTERPTSNFHDVMSRMMDSQVEGAIGGNVFGHFVMTVDYGHARAWFRCVQACTASHGSL